ncbi:MAG: hypothetical protein M9932_12605 [Xanthobacteraceae bacterium]|nr:hypothetical protein [Xanthobacteraceae bacterium]
MSEVLRRIAGTAVLCGGLGLLLYLALVTAADEPITAPALGFVGAGVVAAQVFHLLRDAWHSGIMPERPGAGTSRDANPVWYWVSMLWYGACLIGVVALGLVCLLRIVGL